MGVTSPEEARTFDEVIVGLQHSYPEDKLGEISTSFCFICLLHLANERGLKLETGDVAPSAVPEVEENETVGNIWSLKVSQMPLTRLVFDADRTTGLPGLECYASSVAESWHTLLSSSRLFFSRLLLY